MQRRSMFILVFWLALVPVLAHGADKPPRSSGVDSQFHLGDPSNDSLQVKKERLRQELQKAELSGNKQSIRRVVEQLGDLCYLRGEYEEAMTWFNKLLAMSTQLNDRKCRAVALKKVADVHYYQSNYEQAVTDYEQALAIADEFKDSGLRGAILCNLGRPYRILGKRAKAFECQNEALRLVSQTGDREVEAYIISNLGNLYKDYGKYYDALDCYRKSLLMAREIGHRRGVGLALLNLAETHMELARYENAVEFSRDALTILRELGDSRLEASCLDNLGSVYFAWGQYNKAEEYYLSALHLCRKMMHRFRESKVLEKLGLLYAARGQHDKALKAHQESLRIRRETKDPKTEGRCLLDIGKIMIQQGNYEEALKNFAQALELWQAIGSSTEEAHHLMGSVYLDTGEMDKAEEHILKSGNKSSLGRLALLRRNYEAAVHYYLDVLEAGNRSREVNTRFTAYTGIGRAYEGLEDLIRAEQYYELAVQLTEEIRSSLVPAQRARFYDVRINGFQRSDPAHGLTRVRMKSNRAAKSIDSSEVTRARAFADSLSSRNSRSYAGVPETVLSKEDELVHLVALLKQARDKLNTEQDSERYENLSADIVRSEGELLNFIDFLWKEYPAYASVKYPRPVTLKQSALDPNGFALVYDVLEEGVGIKLIRGREIVQTFYRKWWITELEADVLQFRKSFDQCELEDFDASLAKTLYKRLIAPVISDVPEGSPILIIPDGVLALLPFEALVTDGKVSWKTSGKIPVPQGLTYLGDVYPISYYQSITALTLTRTLGKRSSPRNRMLVIADPVFTAEDSRVAQRSPAEPMHLLSAQNEMLMSLARAKGVHFDRLELTGRLADALKELHSKTADIRLGMDATKASMYQASLRQYGSIIFGTHGYFGKDIPDIQEPVLVLTLLNQPEASDGFLTMTEVMGLDLNADIVALTACQTGLGKNLAGEGIMGMGRAFQYAGAKSVLMTLWSVEQTASVNLVESFFRRLKEGKSKLEALRLARNEIREQGFDHPFFWAPFILVGEVN